MACNKPINEEVFPGVVAHDKQDRRKEHAS